MTRHVETGNPESILHFYLFYLLRHPYPWPASHLWITFDHMLDPEVNDWQTLGAEVDPGIYDSFS